MPKPITIPEVESEIERISRRIKKRHDLNRIDQATIQELIRKRRRLELEPLVEKVGAVQYAFRRNDTPFTYGTSCTLIKLKRTRALVEWTSGTASGEKWHIQIDHLQPAGQSERGMIF